MVKIETALAARFEDVYAEDTLHYAWDAIIVQLLIFLSREGPQRFPLTRARNASNPQSRSWIRGQRPALLVWVNRALLFKGEEKASSCDLHVAESALLTKMTSTWSPLAFGECTYQLGYAAAGSRLNLYAIR